MKNKNNYILPILIGSGILLIGYAVRQIHLLYQSTYKIKNVLLNKLSSRGININLDIELYNRSDISVKIIRQDYTIYLNGKEVSRINSIGRINLFSNSKTLIPLNIDFNPNNFFSGDFITNILNFNLEIKGILTLKAGAISLRNYHINIKYTIEDLINVDKK